MMHERYKLRVFYPANLGELFTDAALLPDLHEVFIVIFEFFFAPAALILLATVLEIENDAIPKFVIVGDATVTVVRLKVAVTLHVDAGDEEI